MLLLEARPTDPTSIAAYLLPIAAVTTIVIIRRSNHAKRRRETAVKREPFVCPTHPVIEPRIGSEMSSHSPWPIDLIRQLVGPAPRDYDAKLKSYLTVLPPKWLLGNMQDEHWLNINHQERMRRDGLVVWATIVQANSYLFKQSGVESGASVIYSTDPWFDKNRNALEAIAQQCFALKGTDPSDPEAAAFARMLTNEMTRGMRLKVPTVFTFNRSVFHSSVLLPRKHFPKGVLAGRSLPIWVDPENTGAVVMVPAAYWPASFTAEWDAEGSG